VSGKSGSVKEDLRTQMEKVGSSYTFSGPTIIYCPTKKITSDVANIVKGKLCRVCRYREIVFFVLLRLLKPEGIVRAQERSLMVLSNPEGLS